MKCFQRIYSVLKIALHYKSLIRVNNAIGIYSDEEEKLNNA